MKKIVVLTATRAEYGLLSPVIKKLDKDPKIDVRVVATGAHLSPAFGMTVNEIKKDGVRVDREIDILAGSDTATQISETMANALVKFSEYFEECRPDALMVLGDRYETLAVCTAAVNCQIPIIHLYGGEATEGAADELIRNAITKLSYLHFTSTKEYRHRVIQMGEDPQRVFAVGAVGVENAMHTELMTLSQLEDSLGCELKGKFAVLTFHPVTLENNTAQHQINELLKAITEHPEITFICTKANADKDGMLINERLEKCAAAYDNIHLFDSLGMKRYLSALSCASFVIGNSSSGIIEAPSFKIPTINIGDREKGRIQAESIINCEPDEKSIKEAIGKALDENFRGKLCNMENPYGDGNTSDKITEITKDFLLKDKLEIQKKFYDINF